jgi:hypothetical protein
VGKESKKCAQRMEASVAIDRPSSRADLFEAIVMVRRRWEDQCRIYFLFLVIALFRIAFMPSAFFLLQELVLRGCEFEKPVNVKFG